MARINLPYVSSEITRHAKRVHYFRKRGQPRIRLPGNIGDAEFMAAYHACLAGQPVPVAEPHKPEIKQVVPITDRKSLRWLCQQYIASQAFLALDPKTRRPRQLILSHICEMPLSDTHRNKKIGDAPFEEMPSSAVRRIRDRKAGTPQAANKYLKTLKLLFRWAVEEEHCHTNPARDVPTIKVNSAGRHTWTDDEVARFEAAHPIGSTARLAFSLLLYTGCRRADVVEFGPQHIKHGELTYTQQKNRKRKPVTLCIPVLPVLMSIIEATPSGHMTFLISSHHKPYSVHGFSARWRKWARAAGLPEECSPHGLRKAGAVRAAENGATSNQLMAIFGWRDINQAERYTRMASQKKLAREAMNTITGADMSGTNVSHLPSRRQKRCDTNG